MSDTRIILVEADALTRDRFERVIENERDMRIIARAETKQQAETLIRTYPFDLLLVGTSLKDCSGLTVIRRTKKQLPKANVVIIAQKATEQNVIDAMEAGASGYLLRNANPDEIVDSLRLMLAGGVAVSPDVTRNVLRAIRKHTAELMPATAVQNDPNPLSERETEILRLLAKGMSFIEIGEILAISPHTVTAHIKKIYRKLQVHSRGEAVFEATQLGII